MRIMRSTASPRPPQPSTVHYSHRFSRNMEKSLVTRCLLRARCTFTHSLARIGTSHPCARGVHCVASRARNRSFAYDRPFRISVEYALSQLLRANVNGSVFFYSESEFESDWIIFVAIFTPIDREAFLHRVRQILPPSRWRLNRSEIKWVRKSKIRQQPIQEEIYSGS